MARGMTWAEIGGVTLEIIEGKHDDALDFIQQACKERLRRRYRKGTRMKLKGTRNPELDGQECVILKVNARRITVGVGEPTTDQWGTTWSIGEYNVSPALLVPLES